MSAFDDVVQQAPRVERALLHWPAIYRGSVKEFYGEFVFVLGSYQNIRGEWRHTVTTSDFNVLWNVRAQSLDQEIAIRINDDGFDAVRKAYGITKK